MAKPKLTRTVVHPLLGEMDVPVDVVAAAAAYPQLDPDDPVQRAALEKLIAREMDRNAIEHDERVLAQLVAEQAERNQQNTLELASGNALDRLSIERGYMRKAGESDAMLRGRVERDVINYPTLAARIKAGGGTAEAAVEELEELARAAAAARPGMSAPSDSYTIGVDSAREEPETMDEQMGEEDMYEEEADGGIVDKAKGQASKLGGAVALGAKLVAVNQGGELMLRIAHKIAAKSPGSAIAAMLEDEDGREVAKAIVAFGLHSAGTYAPLPKGREALQKIGELQLAASTFILGNKYGGLIMAELDGLIGLGDTILESERMAELGPGQPRALADVERSEVRETAKVG